MYATHHSTRRGAEESAPRPRLWRGPSRLRSRTARLVGLALVPGLWFGTADAGSWRANDLSVAPASFGFDTVTLACDLKVKGGASSPGDTGDVARPKYRFQVADDRNGRTWGSDWHSIPECGAQQKVRVTSTIPLLADSTADRRTREVTISVFVDDGSQPRRALKRRFYRWRDGLFHMLPEKRGAWLGQVVRTMEPSAPQPESTPQVIIIELTQAASAGPKTQPMSWGSLKTKYRN